MTNCKFPDSENLFNRFQIVHVFFFLNNVLLKKLDGQNKSNCLNSTKANATEQNYNYTMKIDLP